MAHGEEHQEHHHKGHSTGGKDDCSAARVWRKLFCNAREYAAPVRCNMLLFRCIITKAMCLMGGALHNFKLSFVLTSHRLGHQGLHGKIRHQQDQRYGHTCYRSEFKCACCTFFGLGIFIFTVSRNSSGLLYLQPLGRTKYSRLIQIDIFYSPNQNLKLSECG